MQGAAAALPELVVALDAEEEAAILVRAVLWMLNAHQLHLCTSCSSWAAAGSSFHCLCLLSMFLECASAPHARHHDQQYCPSYGAML